MLVVVDVMVVGLDEVDVSTETKAKSSFRHITIHYDEKFVLILFHSKQTTYQIHTFLTNKMSPFFML